MKWTRGTRSGDIEDRRGQPIPRGARRSIQLGAGGVSVVIVVLVLQALGVDISGLFGGGSSTRRTDTRTETRTENRTTTTQGSGSARPPAEDPDSELVDFITFVITDIQDTFTKVVDEQGSPGPTAGKYRRAKLVIFTEAVDTQCGVSSSAIGPFYCPPDENAYIDLSFYRDLKQRFGAPGDFAQAYVLAHEIGHHLQTVFGISQMVDRKAGRDKKKRNEWSVRQELQADCFAGVWSFSANQRQLLEIGDVEEALTAAAAIGDDRLQKAAGRKVNAETWTHGSSEMRVRWFKRGFEAGRFDACDTYSVPNL
jgi:predicted metalloprotease